MFRKTRHIHFVGIGGIGMSGIAELLLNLGYKVSGSDLVSSENTKHLKKMGAEIYLGHHPEQLREAEVLVISSSIKSDNLEIKSAKERCIPVITRAEMLAELMRLKYGIAVAGTHGKTTTTSLIATILAESRLDPTVIIGGKINNWNSGAKLGQGDFLIAEADESDGTLLRLSPTIAVVTTLDEEHLDYYANLEAIQETFLKFINNLPFYGAAILCLDEENIQSILPEIEKRYITYGLNSQADYTAKDIISSGLRTEFTAYYKHQRLGKLSVNLAGRHNVLNLLASLAVAGELEIEFKNIVSSLKNFSGIKRRFQVKGEKAGIIVVDDYGHHPAEIKATLKTLAEVWPERRRVVIFQPHRFSRTLKLLEEFGKSFYETDYLIITEIYPAGEKPLPGVDGKLIYDCVKKHGHKEVTFIADKTKLLNHLSAIKKEGDLILTLGAGDIYKLGEEFLLSGCG